MDAEISYDLVMIDEMEFVEGTYRVSGGLWRVFVFARGAIAEPKIYRDAVWPSEQRGITVVWPRKWQLNKSVVEATLSEQLGIARWHETAGPDSMQLR